MTDNTKTAPKATISLTSDVLERYESIRTYMIDRMPGITPNSADVIRHALYLADRVVSVDPSDKQGGT